MMTDRDPEGRDPSETGAPFDGAAPPTGDRLRWSYAPLCRADAALIQVRT
jgi:hypothetical protein